MDRVSAAGNAASRFEALRVAADGQARSGRRLRRWRWAVAVLLVLGLLTLALAHERWLRGIASYLDTSVPLAEVDFVMVLAGEPRIRPFYAASYYRAGFARGVLATRPERTPDVIDGLRPSEDELTTQIMALAGVPPEDLVFLPPVVTSTSDEARALRDFLDDNPGVTVTVISHAYHTRRASWILARSLGERADRVRLLGVPDDGFSEEDWWRTESGFMTYLREYLKLLYYRVRY